MQHYTRTVWWLGGEGALRRNANPYKPYCSLNNLSVAKSVAKRCVPLQTLPPLHALHALQAHAARTQPANRQHLHTVCMSPSPSLATSATLATARNASQRYSQRYSVPGAAWSGGVSRCVATPPLKDSATLATPSHTRTQKGHNDEQ